MIINAPLLVVIAGPTAVGKTTGFSVTLFSVTGTASGIIGVIITISLLLENNILFSPIITFICKSLYSSVSFQLKNLLKKDFLLLLC